jgi:hypothetical protein
MVHYTAVPLKSLSLAERTSSYKAIHDLCAPPGSNPSTQHHLNIKELLIPEDPTNLNEDLTLARLYENGHIVAGMLYHDYRPATKYIARLFICAKKGYGAKMNEEFEKHVMESKRFPHDPPKRDRPVKVTLNAIVDPNRNVPGFHMKMGYQPISGHPERDLKHKEGMIPMSKLIPSPPLTPAEKHHLHEMQNRAATMRAALAPKRPHFRGGRRKRFSTRRHKKHNGRGNHWCSCRH